MKLTKELLTTIINEVKTSVSRKFTEICQEDIKFISTSSELKNDLVGIVSFVGDANFILLLMLTDKQLRDISVKFVGAEIGLASDDVGDFVSELANIVFGEITNDMKNSNLNMDRSLPTILRGQNIEPVLRKKAPSITMAFGKDKYLVKLIGATDETLHKKPGT